MFVSLSSALLGTLRRMAYISRLMKYLIIHPKDPTTTFLSKIYAHLKDKTEVNGGITKSELREVIESHDRIILLGHGSPCGLLSRGQFPDAGLYIIDLSMVPAFKEKSNCMYIWCYADQFVHRHGLSGLCSGMFISELREAGYFGFDKINYSLIDQSNKKFSFILSEYIDEPIDVLYKKLANEYKLLASMNPIAKFNVERIYIT